MADKEGEYWKRFSFTDQLTLSDAFDLGLALQRVQWQLFQEPEISDIVRRLQNIQNGIAERDFDTSIQDEIEQVIDKLTEKMKEEDVEELSDDAVNNLYDVCDQWMKVIRQELAYETRIPISRKGFFDVEKAIEAPEDLFDQEVWDWMPERPRDDIRQACRALAVHCPTASVFLALRAVEDRLREWYQEETGGDIEGKSWGRVLDKFEEEYQEDDEDLPPLLSHLGYLKDKRNEVSHPEKSPSWKEAERTIYRVEGTISEIYEEIGPVKRNIDEVEKIHIKPPNAVEIDEDEVGESVKKIREIFKSIEEEEDD